MILGHHAEYINQLVCCNFVAGKGMEPTCFGASQELCLMGLEWQDFDLGFAFRYFMEFWH